MGTAAFCGHKPIVQLQYRHRESNPASSLEVQLPDTAAAMLAYVRADAHCGPVDRHHICNNGDTWLPCHAADETPTILKF